MDKEVIYILGLFTSWFIKYFLVPVLTTVSAVLVLKWLQPRKRKK